MTSVTSTLQTLENDVPTNQLATSTTITTSETKSLSDLDQPPFFIQISRTSPTTTVLTNPITNSVLYTIRNTGRGRFSSRPDLEIFRPTPSHIFIGSIRMTRKETEIKQPRVQFSTTDAVKFGSGYMPSLAGKTLTWSIAFKGRPTKEQVAVGPDVNLKSVPSRNIALLECHAADDPEPIAVAQLYDSIPNGRIEIWTRDACVEVGGDWDALDQLVLIAYANLEKVRRQMMSGVDQGSWGIGMMGGGVAMIG